MSMACTKHPSAAQRGGRCQVCLLEEALAPADNAAPPRRLTIHLPLGLSASSSVFLVRQDAPTVGLLRLKTWHVPAPLDYLDRFGDLQARLTAAGEAAVVVPSAACVDCSGWPSVLSEFRRGIPVQNALRSGALTPSAASALLGPIRDVMVRLHERGLAHGSMVSGNVLVRPDLSAAFLLDFGLSALLTPQAAPIEVADEDLVALRALTDSL
jgi:hypothetical protein